MTPCPAREARCTGDTLAFDDGYACRPLRAERVAEGKVESRVHRRTVGEHAFERELRDLLCEFTRSVQRLAMRHNPIGQPDRQGFLGVDRSSGEDEVERPTEADDAR